MRRIFFFCKSYLLKYKWHLAIYIILTIAMSAGSLVSPYIIGDFVDHLLNANTINFIFRYFVLFVGINLISLIFGYIAGRLYVHLQANLGFELNRNFIQRIQRFPIRFTQKHESAYLNQRVNNDSNALIIFCISVIQNIIVNAVIVVAALGLLFSFHPGLASILLAIAAIYFLIYTLYKQVLYKANHAFQEAQSVFFGKLYEQLFNVRFIKLHSLFNYFIGRLNKSFVSLLTGALKQQKVSYIFGSLDQLVVIMAHMVLLLFGGMEIIAGRLTIGRFIIISSYFNMMLGAMRYFFNMGQTIQNNLVSYNRLQELANIDSEGNGTQTLEAVNSIEIKNLSFAYDTNVVIKDMNLLMEKGRLYAILGANGAGKSTLLDVIMGLQIGNFDGQVLFNGINMVDINMYDLRNRLLSVSEQELTLLTDTLECNLYLNQETAELIPNEVDSLIDMLGLGSYFDTLPDGFSTVVSENATNLSGGEKQKISILRAILKNPDILILDEPTAALDTDSRNRLMNYLGKIKKNKIIIMITHDKEFLTPQDVPVYL